MSNNNKVEFSHADAPVLGVLLANLGTPYAPTPKALRRYLGEFLWDRRIVDLPRPLWWMILHGIILRSRPARSAAAYSKIWTDEGSPLMVISRRQRDMVEARLKERFNGRVSVALGMRYGQPSLKNALRQLRADNVQRLLVLPLYPQYSCSTTASTFDAIAQEFANWRWLPETRFINHYHDHVGYVRALADSVREAWEGREPGEKLLFSFHGTPRRFLEEGDPYYCECLKTARLVANELGLSHERWQATFQSRFGREEWLKPYTDETLEQLARDGVKSVDVICPAFSADCLETLEEIKVENRAAFLEAGGEEFRYIPALNDREDHIDALVELVERHMQGWPEASEEYAPEEEQKQVIARYRQRADNK